MHWQSWVEDAELSSDHPRHLRRVWVQRGRLWRDCHHHMDQEVARWDVGGIERPNDGDAVLRIICVKTELFMQFADGRLLRCLAVLHLPAREGELPAMRAALLPPDRPGISREVMTRTSSQAPPPLPPAPLPFLPPARLWHRSWLLARHQHHQ